MQVLKSEILGHKCDFSQDYAGYLKCKLIHSKGVSVIVPDQVYLDWHVGDGEILWFQPCNFFAPLLLNDENGTAHCGLTIDIDSGYSIRVTMDTEGFVRQFNDGSELYRCHIQGPKKLSEMASGVARISTDSYVLIRLFHFTSSESKSAILRSKQLWGSAWNIQGTEKKLTNVTYAYLTHLKHIGTDTDLQRIAMASGGKLHLVIDDAPVPLRVTEKDFARYAQYILALEVYRCSTTDRKQKVTLWVPAELLAPQHMFLHSPYTPPWYYAICSRYIHRIGLIPGCHAQIVDANVIEVASGDRKLFDYIVAGDATTLDGLKAPYDEEDTAHIFKIERVPATSNILDFWFSHANQDLFTNKDIELAEFTLDM